MFLGSVLVDDDILCLRSSEAIADLSQSFSKTYLLMRSAEPAGKWDEIACKLLYLRRPWETGLAVVGLDTLSCLKLCFQLILMSAASTASKSACCFMTYVEVVESSKPRALQARRRRGGSVTDSKCLTRVSPPLHKKYNSF